MTGPTVVLLLAATAMILESWLLLLALHRIYYWWWTDDGYNDIRLTDALGSFKVTVLLGGWVAVYSDLLGWHNWVPPLPQRWPVDFVMLLMAALITAWHALVYYRRHHQGRNEGEQP